MPRLSVVMIVKNEADCLGRCLESVRGIADEIVIADTGSTDETIAIAKHYNANVFSIPWNNDFAEARNAALERATGDWILHMDADEFLSPMWAPHLRRVVDRDGNGADAFQVALLNCSNDVRAWRWIPAAANDECAHGFAGYILTFLLRLFRNGKGYEYREAVHENITESVIEAKGMVRVSPVQIHHYGYGSDAERKGEHYLAIARKKVDQRPKDPKAWHDLCEQLLALGQTDEAENAARQALARDCDHVGATISLANILLNRGSLDEARKLLERKIKVAETPSQVRVALGAIACRQGRVAEGLRLLENVVEDLDVTVIGRLYLARALDLTGEETKARHHLCKAEALAPSLNESRARIAAHDKRRTARKALEEGNSKESLRLLVEALSLDPEDPLIHFALGVVLNGFGDLERASESFRRAQTLAPSLANLKRTEWPGATSE